MANETWKNGRLDEPDITLQGIRNVGPRSQQDVDALSQRIAIERNNGVTPQDTNSILNGLDPRAPIMQGAIPGTASQTPQPNIDNPRPYRGGSATFESTMDAASDRAAKVENNEQFYRNTGSAIWNEQQRGNAARAANNATPGANYQTSNPDVALTDAEKARGASVTISTPGQPGQYGVNALPQGFTSYQNRDGTWTLLDKNNKKMVFKDEAEVSAYFNSPQAQQGQPQAPTMANAPMMPPVVSGAGAVMPQNQGAVTTPNVGNPQPPMPPIDPNASPAANARMRDEQRNAADLAQYGQPSTAPGKTRGPAPAAQFPGPERPLSVMQQIGRRIAQPTPSPMGAFGPDGRWDGTRPSPYVNAPTAQPAPVVGPAAIARAQSIAAPVPPPVNLRPPTQKPVERQAEAVAEQFNPIPRARFIPY